MTMKDWWKHRKLKKLRGVEALDHGIVRGQGIPHLEKWKQTNEVKYWKALSEKEAMDFYMSLPAVTGSPRLRSIGEFRKWNSRRKQLIDTAEPEFRKKNNIPISADLSQAEQNLLNEFTKQRVHSLIDKPEIKI
jgi:hypothetical protein